MSQGEGGETMAAGTSLVFMYCACVMEQHVVCVAHKCVYEPTV